MSSYLDGVQIRSMFYDDNVVKFCYYDNQQIFTCGTVITIGDESYKTVTLSDLSSSNEGSCTYLTADGNHVLIVGGLRGNALPSSTAIAFDRSLTKVNATAFSRTTIGTKATIVGNYTLFAGGSYYATEGDNSTGTDHKIVNAYNNSLTRTVATSLTYAMTGFGIGSVGNYAIITGGIDYSGAEADNTKTYCTYYNSSLTKSSITPPDTMFERFIGSQIRAQNYVNLVNSKENMFCISTTLTISTKILPSTATDSGDIYDIKSVMHNNDMTIVSIYNGKYSSGYTRLLYTMSSSGTIVNSKILSGLGEQYDNLGTSLVSYKISDDNYASIIGCKWSYNENSVGTPTGRNTAIGGMDVHVLGDYLFHLNGNKANFYKINYTI